MNIKHLSLAVVSAFTLAACGGGGGNNSAPAASANASPAPASNPAPANNPAPAENKTSNSGSVDAAFVAKATARYMIASSTLQSAGNPSPFTQGSDGAVTVLGGYSLTGTPTAIQEISGNANYAQGRWNAGSATSSSGSFPLGGVTNESYHYVVFNKLASMPVNGTMTCDAGKFTKPTYAGGGTVVLQPANFVGTSTGTAAVVVDGNGAHVSLSITSTGNGLTGTANLQGTVASVDSSYISGGLGGLGTGGMVTIGDAGNGAVFVVASYGVALGNSNVFRGVATFTCH